MKVDLKKLQDLVGQKYLSCRERKGKLIWNYTAKCQYEKFWTEETMMCRGLITDLDGEVLSRPFKKFFNIGEYDGPLPEGAPGVHEKLDGSLGIVYWEDGRPRIATRGSFESEQAKVANEMLSEINSCTLEWMREIMLNGVTLLFEIVYPENRIVVDYGGRRELILLGGVDVETGAFYSCSGSPFATAKNYGPRDVGELLSRQSNNEEGYVLHWPNGLMLKVKFDEYVRLHRIVTGFTKRRVWEILWAGESMDPYLERVPDEFYDWVKEKIAYFHEEYDSIERQAEMLAASVEGLETRKEKAEAIKEVGGTVAAVAFNMMDGKDYKDIIWKSLRPEHETPFKIEV